MPPDGNALGIGVALGHLHQVGPDAESASAPGEQHGRNTVVRRREHELLPEHVKQRFAARVELVGPVQRKGPNPVGVLDQNQAHRSPTGAVGVNRTGKDS